jgi:hypothetical protein
VVGLLTRTGEIVACFVRLRIATAPTREGVAFCRERLSSQKTPAQWIVVRERPSRSGKIRKFVLRDGYLAGSITATSCNCRHDTLSPATCRSSPAYGPPGRTRQRSAAGVRHALQRSGLFRPQREFDAEHRADLPADRPDHPTVLGDDVLALRQPDAAPVVFVEKNPSNIRRRDLSEDTVPVFDPDQRLHRRVGADQAPTDRSCASS